MKPTLTPSAAPAGAPASQSAPVGTDLVAAGPLVLVDETFTEQDRERGRQLSAAWAQACGATRHILIFGAMMLAQRETIVSTRGHVRTGGADAKGDGLKGWLEACAPDVAKSRATAYRYMGLAEGIRDEFKLGKKADLTLLLTAADEELAEPLRKKQREILDFVEGKSQRQLVLALDHGDSKPRGGNREKKGPAETPEEKFAREQKALHDRFEQTFDGVRFATADNLFHVANDAEIETAIDYCEEFVAAARAFLATPKGQRAAIAIGEAA